MKALPFVVILLLALGCQSKTDFNQLDDFSEQQLAKWNRKLTDVIVADIFTPPVASRIYAYANIAAFEAVRFQNDSLKSYAGILNGFSAGPTPDPDQTYYFPLAEIVAFTTTARELVYNGPMVDELEVAYLTEIKNLSIDSDTYDRSIVFGRAVGQHILRWAKADGYNERTSNIAFTVNDDPGRWRPTPPDYADGIEPHWNKLRPFLMDSANQFNPGAPTAFDTIPESTFYKETMDVYSVVKNGDDEKLAIAKFWDCNPNISYTQGHVMYFHQQISPGGHWIHIACQVLEAEKLEEAKSAEAMSKVALTIADAFISCWDEKYRSSLVRPETYINRYIDKDWMPILQTPAFPEHTSGHSVASASASTILTQLFGEKYYFVDSTEVPYGLPTRSYESFLAAAEEAAISRHYGGIHYMPAITKGVSQGKNVGNMVIEKLKDF